eukprot:303151-Chlamydomonas_euryale.AAC.2
MPVSASPWNADRSPSSVPIEPHHAARSIPQLSPRCRAAGAGASVTPPGSGRKGEHAVGAFSRSVNPRRAAIKA